MKPRCTPYFAALLGLSGVLHAQTVRFQTILGGIDVVLTPASAPITVANFLTYVDSAAYSNTIIHRSLNAAENASQAFYLIQGGGYIIKNHLPFQIPSNGPIANEFKLSNTRGTIAMAQFAGDINSGSDQWYFNTIDNSGALDSQQFAVFGNVANDASLAVMDNINAISTFTFNGLTNLPLVNYTAGKVPADANYVYVNSVSRLAPANTAAGVLSAATFASNTSTGISPGEIITLFGTQLGPTQVTTLGLTSAGLVDTTIQGTQVLFNGVPGPMIFTSTGQIAVIAPYSIASLSSVSVVVSYLGLQTAPISFKVVPANPGLFTLNNSGKGDAAIVHPDGSVVNTANPAAAGDFLELYGEGYGVLSGAQLPDGAVVTGPTSAPAATTTLLIDGKPVPTQYIGGAGGDVNGVLQVNFTVPQLAPGSHQLQIQVGSAISPAGVNLQTK